MPVTGSRGRAKNIRKLSTLTANSTSTADSSRLMRNRVTAASQREDLGSSASRNESPNRLKASTSTKIVTPGNSTYAGSVCRYEMLRKIIAPKSGVGSMMPMPRNDRAASPVTYAGTASEKDTRIGAQMLG